MEENNPVRDIYQDPNASQAKALVRYTFRPSESWGSSLWAVVYDHQGFMGLHVDIEKNALRKNNCIINTGDNPTKEERDRKTGENKLKYGLSKEYVKQIKLPKINTSQFKQVIMLEEINSGKFSTIERIHHLEGLKKVVEFKMQLLADRGADEYRSNFKNKGVMAPVKIEYYNSSTAYQEQTEPVIISLKKTKDGKYSVL